MDRAEHRAARRRTRRRGRRTARACRRADPRARRPAASGRGTRTQRDRGEPEVVLLQPGARPVPSAWRTIWPAWRVRPVSAHDTAASARPARYSCCGAGRLAQPGDELGQPGLLVADDEEVEHVRPDHIGLLELPTAGQCAAGPLLGRAQITVQRRLRRPVTPSPSRCPAGCGAPCASARSRRARGRSPARGRSADRSASCSRAARRWRWRQSSARVSSTVWLESVEPFAARRGLVRQPAVEREVARRRPRRCHPAPPRARARVWTNRPSRSGSV